MAIRNAGMGDRRVAPTVIMCISTKAYSFFLLKNQTAFLAGSPSHKHGMIQKHIEK